jgi:protein TonB
MSSPVLPLHSPREKRLARAGRYTLRTDAFMATAPASTPTATPDSAAAGVVSQGWLASNSMFADYGAPRGKRAAGATAISLAIHALIFALIGYFTYQAATTVAPVQETFTKLIFLQQPGPGGGGGGSQAPAPKKELSIPKPKAPDPLPVPQVTPPSPIVPPPTLVTPVVTPNATIAQATGSSSVSLANLGGGGRGTGIGSGTGSGVGPGRGGGFGDGAYMPGAGIVNPELLVEVKPGYTADAMRAKVQGLVYVEAVVLENGTVGDVRVVRSLEPGLDQKALEAARKWIFRPARKDGKPVPLRISIELRFSLF